MSCFPDSPLGVFHFEGVYGIPQGATWDVPIRYLENGNAVNFSGGTAVMQVRTDYDKEIILELSTVDGGIELGDGTGGTPNVILHFTPARTSPLEVFEGIYDIEVTVPSGAVYKFLKGRFQIDPEVTK